MAQFPNATRPFARATAFCKRLEMVQLRLLHLRASCSTSGNWILNMNLKPLFLAFSLSASGAAFAQNHSGAIVPGAGIGKMRLGQTRAAARTAMNEKPTATFSLPRGFSSDLWKWVLGDSQEECFLEALYQNGRVVQLEVLSPEFKMQGVEDVNMTSAWLQALGQPTRISTYAYNRARKGVSRQKYFDWTRRGLALETQRHRALNGESSDDLHTIIVHRKGVRVVADFDGTLASN